MAAFFDGTPLYLQVSVVLSSSLMLVAAWLIIRENRIAALLLLLSVIVYFLSMVVPAFSRHGWQLFSQFIPAFYWSLAMRLSLTLLAYHLLHRASLRG
jgi:Na+-translocating ferredoxin:NAD+ oxidoreductase RnfE subunit